MNMRWFLQMSKWARNPPPARVVLMWAAVVAICLAIVLFETVLGWPEWATVNRGGVPRVRIPPAP